jgi:hypothetical protein
VCAIRDFLKCFTHVPDTNTVFAMRNDLIPIVMDRIMNSNFEQRRKQTYLETPYLAITNSFIDLVASCSSLMVYFGPSILSITFLGIQLQSISKQNEVK